MEEIFGTHHERQGDWRDNAQICPNGHLANSSMKLCPEFNQEFCQECGEKTLTACQHCQEPIRGDYHMENVLGGFGYTPPRHCHNCGKPFPWIERTLEAAKELTDEIDELIPEEREKLKGTLNDLIVDTPRTELAATRFKKLVSKGGKATALALEKILTGIVTEAAKKAIWG